MDKIGSLDQIEKWTKLKSGSKWILNNFSKWTKSNEKLEKNIKLKLCFKTRQNSTMDKQMVKEEEQNKSIEARAQSILSVQNKSKNESKVGEMKLKVGE